MHRSAGALGGYHSSRCRLQVAGHQIRQRDPTPMRSFVLSATPRGGCYKSCVEMQRMLIFELLAPRICSLTCTRRAHARLGSGAVTETRQLRPLLLLFTCHNVDLLGCLNVAAHRVKFFLSHRV
mmetsp:Transcript_22466/g.50769  ORF Transcript_22466/g.50769 Transcript_22466/m.50769 type:complete len:124 (+) Transcript_22466:374-745(+)